MKLVNLSALALISVLVTVSSQASVLHSTSPWGKLAGETWSGTYYSSDYDSRWKLFKVIIGNSASGRPALSFSNSYFQSNDSSCTVIIGAQTTKTTMTFNGKAIKMSKTCMALVGTSKASEYYTTQTKRGQKYIVNLFKTSASPIKVEFEGEVIHIPVENFNLFWGASYGNNSF